MLILGEWIWINQNFFSGNRNKWYKISKNKEIIKELYWKKVNKCKTSDLKPWNRLKLSKMHLC